MITTDVDSALAELDEHLDPVALAAELLRETGEAALALDQSHPHVGWADRTGELHESFRYEVHTALGRVVLEGRNDAEHALYLHVREGISVLRAFDSGEIVRMLHEAFRSQDKDRVI